jgi:hypothetical protein
MAQRHGVHASHLGAIGGGRLFVRVRGAAASQRLPHAATPATRPSASKDFIDGNCRRERSAVMPSAARLAVVRAAQILSFCGFSTGEIASR